jgi:murein DD-endopeptidase MepM/ murein hydrolase activator NlpD
VGVIHPVQAQEEQPSQPVYIIQPGDTLWNIARRLHVSYRDLLEENNLTEDSPIHPGETLTIPGLGSMSGVLTTKAIPFGESLSSLSDRYQISEEALIRLNRLTTPMELYAGLSVVLLADEEGNISEWTGKRKTVPGGRSLLEAAVEENVNPWMVVSQNGLEGTWDLIPGQVVRVPSVEDSGPGGFPGEISDVTYSPTKFVQGNTMVFRVTAPSGTEVYGNFGDHNLHFFPSGDGYVALQGVHAMAETGLHPISLYGHLADGTPFAHRQMVRVLGNEFNYVKINGVPPETVSIELSRKEHEKLAAYAEEANPEKSWKGKFSVPVPEKYNNPYPPFGDRRSFNGSGFYYYHSGIDFSTWGNYGIDIYAAASGKVVYVEKGSKIYGGLTMIDHGWGIYTMYGHQEEIYVTKGQRVKAGEVIGTVGSTGRSTGPHLHWEVWVGGVPVDPKDWLKNRYP